MKRLFDIVAASVGVVVTSPLFLAAAAAVTLGSEGPALYRAIRVGRGGRTFEMLKLRTMRVGADAQGPAVTAVGDPRITPVGRFLRRTKLDEIPQLINVLRGDMSLVGPRPEHPEFVERYTDEQRQVLSVRPGITGLATLDYIDEEEILAQGETLEQYLSAVMPQKLALDLQYVRTATFWGDLKILGRTVASVARRQFVRPDR